MDPRGDGNFYRPHIIIRKIEVNRGSINGENESELESPVFSMRDNSNRDLIREDSSPASPTRFPSRSFAKREEGSPEKYSVTRSPRSYHKSMIFAKTGRSNTIDPRKILDSFVAFISSRAKK